MNTRHSIGGRSSGLLWLGVLAGLALIGALAYILLVVVPERQSARVAQEQRAQATATAEARTAEIERAYGAGIAFVAAGDWEKATEQLSLIVALDPTYKDAAAQLSETRNQANATRKMATATAHASELQRIYDTGVVFAATEEWEKAAEQFAKAIAIEPGYKDAGNRLAEARIKGRAQAEASGQATATAQTKATATAQARSSEVKPTVILKPTPQPIPRSDPPTTVPPSVSPVQFIKDYYAGINARRYTQTWAMLSDNFKRRMHCCNSDGAYQYQEEYLTWWNTIARVDVLSASAQNRGSSAVVTATLRYHKKTGRASDAKSTFTLVAYGNTWLID